MQRANVRLARGTSVLVLVPAALLVAFSSTVARGPDAQPDPALQTYLGANGLLNRGLYELAAAEYRKFLDQHEDHEKASVARYGLGVSLFRMGHYDAVVKELTPLLKRSGFDFAAEVGTIVGQCHLQLRQYAKSVTAFKRVVRKHSEHDLADDAAAGLTEALHLVGRYDDAVESCRDFVEGWRKSPLRERVEFFAALSAMAKQDYTDAAKRFAALLERYPDGPFVEQASLLVAQCYHHDNGIDKAIRQYRKVLKQSSSRHIPDALLGLATLLQKGEKHAEAGRLLDQLLEKFPQSALRIKALSQRGRTFFDQGQFDRAAEMFELIIDANAELVDEAAYWAAKCNLRAGNFDEAARRLGAASEKFPESALLAEMLYDRAIALVRGARHDDAIEALGAFRSRFPEHDLGPQALQLLAATEHQQGRYDQSLSYCRDFLDRYGPHGLAAGVAFLSAENDFLPGRYDEAVGSYRSFLSRHEDDPQAPKAKFRLGIALYRLERFDEAQDALENVTRGTTTDDAFRPALLALGDIHFQRSEWKQAEVYLGDYLLLGPDMPSADDALLKLALSRQRQDRSEEALTTYDQLLARFGESKHHLQTVFERGQALVALGRLDEAAEAFQAVVSEDGGSRFAPYALNHLAVIAMQHKDFGEAAALYKRAGKSDSDTGLKADAMFQSGQALMAAQQFEKAGKAFASFLENSPTHARVDEARAQQAIALARRDMYAEAVGAIEEVERGSPAGATVETSLDPSLRSALGYEKAWCLRELGRVDEAADAYRTLLDEGLAGEFETHALLELSGIEVDKRRFEQATQLLRRLRDIAGSDSAAAAPKVREQGLYRLGVCEFELNRFRQAAELFEEFVDGFPQSPLTASACFYCGEAFFRLAGYESAVKYLTRIVDQFEDDSVLGPALLRLGESLAHLQRWARSERVFTDYLDRFDGSKHRYQAQFGRGWAREHQKRYDEAINAYRQVVTGHQGPTAARAQFQIGECLFAKKQYGQAVRELLKVDILYAYPEWSAAALFEAARCFEKLGKAVEARSHFKQVSERHKDTRWAQMASRRLNELSGAGVPGR